MATMHFVGSIGDWPGEKKFILCLNEYQVSNLREALQAAGMRGPRYTGIESSPLKVLDSGDWLGEICNVLEEMEVTHSPNVTAEEFARRANKEHK